MNLVIGPPLSIDGSAIWSLSVDEGARFEYDPLHDDAQCMALVKKFELLCDPQYNTHIWKVWCATARTESLDYVPPTLNPNLNRAVVEYVATMQKGIKS
jgi:hypothetical protein